MQSFLIRYFDRFFFSQANSVRRLGYIRISTALVLLIMLSVGPYSNFFPRSGNLIERATPGLTRYFPQLSVLQFELLKYAVLISAAVLAIGVLPRISAAVCSVLFFLFNGYVSSFGTSWNQSTHLHLILLLLCFAPASKELALFRRYKTENHSAKDLQFTSWCIASLQLLFAGIYFNAAVGKLNVAGIDWFLTGSRIEQTMIYTKVFSGVSQLEYVLGFPWLFPVMGIMTAIFEFGFLPALLITQRTRVLGVIALVFHISIELSLDVFFYHLWLLIPSIFILGAGTVHQR